MAAVKRIVSTAFWTDSKVDDFTPEDKYFMLYLLTNPFTTQLGIYELSVKQAAFQMGYSTEAVLALIERFQNKYGMILYSQKTGEVAILNYLRHSIVKGGKPVEDCIRKDIRNIKDKSLIAKAFRHIKDEDDLNETVKKIVSLYFEENEDDNDNDNDNERIVDESSSNREKKVSEVTRAVIDYLNKRAGTAYKATREKTKKLVSARMNEGFTEEDFFTVIDIKVDEWGKPPKPGATDMRPFIRPDTLFSTKFESYLNQRRVINDGEHERIGEHLI